MAPPPVLVPKAYPSVFLDSNGNLFSYVNGAYVAVATQAANPASRKAHPIALVTVAGQMGYYDLVSDTYLPISSAPAMAPAVPAEYPALFEDNNGVIFFFNHITSTYNKLGAPR